jgi:hypothetical protein
MLFSIKRRQKLLRNYGVPEILIHILQIPFVTIIVFLSKPAGSVASTASLQAMYALSSFNVL